MRVHWFNAPLLAGVLLAALVCSAGAQPANIPSGAIWLLQIKDAIGPATSDYAVRGIASANHAGAALIVIEMDTPGGLDGAMREIISAILASEVPVATFVAPKGARAASAGTYILYASHFAVMSEATNLGAATPVQIVPELPTGPGSDKPPATPTAMEKKIVNDASAYIRGLAALRGRNAEWGEQAVRDGVSLSATEALDQHVIDYVARDLDDLVDQLEGKSATVGGREVILQIRDAPRHLLAPDWRTELLATLTNPNIVLILGMIGVYGILLEFYHPGATIPGVAGIICLILAGYALHLLPVNYAGLGLILVGLALMAAEAFSPSFGVLGIGGIIAFTIGGIMLFDSDLEAFSIGLPALAATAIVLAGLIILTIQIALKVRRKGVRTGVQSMLGQTGEVLVDIPGVDAGATGGQVRVAGEIWKAGADTTLPPGATVRVTAVRGMVLMVEPATSGNFDKSNGST